MVFRHRSPHKEKRMAKTPYGCGIGPALDVIGGKWKAVLLWELQAQPRRFGELKRLVPQISEKVLTLHLRELERDRLVHRQVLEVVPAHVEYSATDWGRSLNAALAALADWGERYEAEVLAPAARNTWMSAASS
jgi:DNA-binding HxlR family transcriptional regulator